MSIKKPRALFRRMTPSYAIFYLGGGSLYLAYRISLYVSGEVALTYREFVLIFMFFLCLSWALIQIINGVFFVKKSRRLGWRVSILDLFEINVPVNHAVLSSIPAKNNASCDLRYLPSAPEIVNLLAQIERETEFEEIGQKKAEKGKNE